jgi:hypothetical protein
MGYYNRHLERTEVEGVAERLGGLTYGGMMEIADALADAAAEWASNGGTAFDPTSEEHWAQLLHGWADGSESDYQRRAEAARREEEAQEEAKREAAAKMKAEAEARAKDQYEI